MNKHEKELLTKLFWHLQRNKNEHLIIYSAQMTLSSIIKGEHGIARKLLDSCFNPVIPIPNIPPDDSSMPKEIGEEND